jgi:hypothetical protein
VLVGKILRYETTTSKYGGEVKIAIVLTEDGQEIAVWVSSKIQLKAEFESWDPQVGEIIGLKYMGEQLAKNGHIYHTYLLRVKGRHRGIDISSNTDADSNPFDNE